MKMAVWIASVAVLLAFAVSGQAVAQQEQHYGLIILDTLGGGGTFAAEAHGLNNAGATSG